MDTGSGDGGLARREATDAQERFRILYEELVGPIYRFCRQRLSSVGGTAEDVTADVFTAVWRKIDKVPPPPEDRVYIYGIAYREVRSQQRRLWRRLRLQRRLDAEWSAASIVDRGSTTDHPAAEWVRSAVAKLPAPEREALLLVLCDGFSHAEAGQLLGCSANAVALRLHKARGRLRAEAAWEPASVLEEPSLYLYREGS